MDPRLEEAAMSSVQPGCRRSSRLPRVLRRAVIGAIFAFIISFSDINLALLSCPGTIDQPAVQIFSQISGRATRRSPPLDAADLIIALIYRAAHR